MEYERGIRGTVDDHFRNLFTTNGTHNWGSLLDCVKSVVTREINENLTMPIAEEEVKHAVFQIGGLKAPGPDGFQGVFFFQSFKEIISPKVRGLATGLINGENRTRDLNSTHIVLIS